MKNFFISYTGVDTKWAEWIGYVLEEKGFSTIIQAWDFRPGSNFVVEMQNATAADRTIMVLSPEYLKSVFTSPEWAAAFAQDPQGLGRKLIPVMVRSCQPPGLLAATVHISILGLDEAAAEKKLLDGIDQTRAKPSSRPAFPGSMAARKARAFPGPGTSVGGPASRPVPYLPTPKRMSSDIDKRRFIKQSFETIRALFEDGSMALSQQHPSIEREFEMHTAMDFRVEIFVDGKSRCYGRVWIGGMHLENAISYSETRSMGDSCNEIITLSDVHRDELRLSALMAMGLTQIERTLDMKRLTPDQAANYL